MTIATYIFLAVLGLVAGGAIVWVLVAAHPFETPEEPPHLPDPVEPAFLAAEMTRRGRPMDEATARELLNLHLDYLEGRARANIAEADRQMLEQQRAAYQAERQAEEAATASKSGSKTPQPESKSPRPAKAR